MSSCSDDCACNSDSSSKSLASCGRLPKQISDRLESVELFTEMWVTLGVSVPVFLVCILWVMQLLPGDGRPILSNVLLAPVLTSLICVGAIAVVSSVLRTHPLRAFPDVSAEVRAEVQKSLRVATSMMFVSAVLCIAILGLFNSMLIGELAELGSALGFQTNMDALRGAVTVTLAIQTFTAGILGGYIQTAMWRRGIIYGAGLLVLGQGTLFVL